MFPLQSLSPIQSLRVSATYMPGEIPLHPPEQQARFRHYPSVPPYLFRLRSPDRECIPQIPRSTLPYKAKKVVPVKRITCFSYFSFLVCKQSHLLRNARDCEILHKTTQQIYDIICSGSFKYELVAS